MASSAFTVCLARDGGRIGCKLLRDNTVSTVHPDTPAARASLRRGDRVIQVNGRAVHSDNGAFEALKKQTGAQIELSIVRDESHSELSTNQSLKRQRSPRQSAGTTKKEPSKSVQYVSGCDKSLPSSKERNKQRCSSKDHITPSPRSLSPIRVASARSGCTQVAGRTSASSASSSLEARVSSNARRRLEHLLESRAVDVKADVLSRCEASIKEWKDMAYIISQGDPLLQVESGKSCSLDALNANVSSYMQGQGLHLLRRVLCGGCARHVFCPMRYGMG